MRLLTLGFPLLILGISCGLARNHDLALTSLTFTGLSTASSGDFASRTYQASNSITFAKVYRPFCVILSPSQNSSVRRFGVHYPKK